MEWLQPLPLLPDLPPPPPGLPPLHHAVWTGDKAAFNKLLRGRSLAECEPLVWVNPQLYGPAATETPSLPREATPATATATLKALLAGEFLLHACHVITIAAFRADYGMLDQLVALVSGEGLLMTPIMPPPDLPPGCPWVSPEAAASLRGSGSCVERLNGAYCAVVNVYGCFRFHAVVVAQSPSAVKALGEEWDYHLQHIVELEQERMRADEGRAGDQLQQPVGSPLISGGFWELTHPRPRQQQQEPCPAQQQEPCPAQQQEPRPRALLRTMDSDNYSDEEDRLCWPPRSRRDTSSGHKLSGSAWDQQRVRYYFRPDRSGLMLLRARLFHDSLGQPLAASLCGSSPPGAQLCALKTLFELGTPPGSGADGVLYLLNDRFKSHAEHRDVSSTTLFGILAHSYGRFLEACGYEGISSSMASRGDAQPGGNGSIWLGDDGVIKRQDYEGVLLELARKLSVFNPPDSVKPKAALVKLWDRVGGLYEPAGFDPERHRRDLALLAFLVGEDVEFFKEGLLLQQDADADAHDERVKRVSPARTFAWLLMDALWVRQVLPVWLEDDVASCPGLIRELIARSMELDPGALAADVELLVRVLEGDTTAGTSPAGDSAGDKASRAAGEEASQARGQGDTTRRWKQPPADCPSGASASLWEFYHTAGDMLWELYQAREERKLQGATTPADERVVWDRVLKVVTRIAAGTLDLPRSMEAAAAQVPAMAVAEAVGRLLHLRAWDRVDLDMLAGTCRRLPHEAARLIHTLELAPVELRDCVVPSALGPGFYGVAAIGDMPVKSRKDGRRGAQIWPLDVPRVIYWLAESKHEYESIEAACTDPGVINPMLDVYGPALWAQMCQFGSIPVALSLWVLSKVWAVLWYVAMGLMMPLLFAATDTLLTARLRRGVGPKAGESKVQTAQGFEGKRYAALSTMARLAKHSTAYTAQGSRRFRPPTQQSRIQCHRVPLAFASAMPTEMLHALVSSPQVNGEFFATPVMRAVVTWRWRAFARYFMMLQFVEHLIYMVTFLVYALSLSYPSTLAGVVGEAATTLVPTSACALPPTGLQRALLIALSVLTLTCVTQEGRQLRFAGLYGWMRQPWNLMEFSSSALVISIVALHFSCNTQAEWLRALASMEVILLFVRLLYFAMAVDRLGSFFRMVIEVFRDLSLFFIFLGILFVGWGLALCVMQGQNVTVIDTYQQLWTMVFGDFGLSLLQDANAGSSGLNHLWRVFMSLYMILVTIILLNILIAIINDSYERINDAEAHEALRTRAMLVVEAESVLPGWLAKQILEELPRHSLYVITLESARASAGASAAPKATGSDAATPAGSAPPGSGGGAGSAGPLLDPLGPPASWTGRTGETKRHVSRVGEQLQAALERQQADLAALRRELAEQQKAMTAQQEAMRKDQAEFMASVLRELRAVRGLPASPVGRLGPPQATTQGDVIAMAPEGVGRNGVRGAVAAVVAEGRNGVREEPRLTPPGLVGKASRGVADGAAAEKEAEAQGGAVVAAAHGRLPPLNATPRQVAAAAAPEGPGRSGARVDPLPSPGPAGKPPPEAQGGGAAVAPARGRLGTL